MLFNNINTSWIQGGLNSGNDSVKGFAFELAVIVHIRDILKGYLPEEKLTYERFDGDYPNPSKLNKEGICLFWPNNWRLKNIDALIRIVGKKTVGESVVTSVMVDTDHSQRIKKRKKGNSFSSVVHSVGKSIQSFTPLFSQLSISSTASSDVTTLLPIQITIKSPKDHMESLNFYDANESDYKHYLTEEEKRNRTWPILYKFIWIIPTGADSSICEHHGPPSTRNVPHESLNYEQKVFQVSF